MNYFCVYLTGLILLAHIGIADAGPTEKNRADYRRPDPAAVLPDDADTDAKIMLGEMLFFDPRLSGSGKIACASCHNPAHGWEDGLATGVGHNGVKLGRHSPTILNLAWGGPYFWDGRAPTLAEQAKGPIASPVEMNMSHEDAVLEIVSVKGYKPYFDAAFPGQAIGIDHIAEAIALYEMTVVSGQAPFDRWLAGDKAAMSPAAVRGFDLFNGKAKCVACHRGWRFTDDGFHDIGLPDSSDIGRAAVFKIDGLAIFDHAFKTPTLRSIAERAPYMHDGSIKTLRAVVDHYADGVVNRPSRSPSLPDIRLTEQEREDLVAFMEALSDIDPVIVQAPKLPE